MHALVLALTLSAMVSDSVSATNSVTAAFPASPLAIALRLGLASGAQIEPGPLGDFRSISVPLRADMAVIHPLPASLSLSFGWNFTRIFPALAPTGTRAIKIEKETWEAGLRLGLLWSLPRVPLELSAAAIGTLSMYVFDYISDTPTQRAFAARGWFGGSVALRWRALRGLGVSLVFDAEAALQRQSFPRISPRLAVDWNFS